MCTTGKEKIGECPETQISLGKLVKLGYYFHISFSVYQVVVQYDSGLDLSPKHVECGENMMRAGRR